MLSKTDLHPLLPSHYLSRSIPLPHLRPPHKRLPPTLPARHPHRPPRNLRPCWPLAHCPLQHRQRSLQGLAIRSHRKRAAKKFAGKDKERFRHTERAWEAPGIIRRATGKFSGAYGIGRYDDTSYETLRVGQERGRSRSRSHEPLRSRGPSREPPKEREVEKLTVVEADGRTETRYESYRHHEGA